MKLHLFKNVSESDLLISKQKNIINSLHDLLISNPKRNRNNKKILTTISERKELYNSETTTKNNTENTNQVKNKEKIIFRNRDKKFRLITGLNKLHSSNSEIIVSRDKSKSILSIPELKLKLSEKNKAESMNQLNELLKYKSRNQHYENLKEITYTFSEKKKQIIKKNLSNLKFKGTIFPKYLKQETEKEQNQINNKNKTILERQEADKMLSVYANEEIDNDTYDLKKTAYLNTYITPEFEKTDYADKNKYKIFYKKSYKDNEIIRKGGIKHETPSFNLIRASKKFRVAPNPIFFAKKDGESNILNLKNKILGDNYIKCLNESLKISNHITSINLEKNRLSDLSLIPLLKTILNNNNLLEKLLEINLSYNKIGVGSVELLVKYMLDYSCFLQNLNMENNSLGNINAIKIMEAISKNLKHEFKYLNLAKNLLDDDIADGLANLIKNCDKLKVLILYQNQLSNKGGGILMKEIKNHSGLKILDLSWNLLGENLDKESSNLNDLLKLKKNNSNLILNNAYLNEIKYSSLKLERNSSYSYRNKTTRNKASYFATQLCELFHNKQCELLHLDISYNNINYIDCKEISEHIKHNHTILGIHVDGNNMYTDGFGFVYPINKSEYKEDHFAKSQIFYRISEEHPLISSNTINLKKLRGKNNCWICEGWREIKFNYKPNDVTKNENDNIKVYLNFENYKSINLNELSYIKNELNENDSNFQIHRVCPPGELYFFLTKNGIPISSYGKFTHRLTNSILFNGDETPNENNTENNNKRNSKCYIIKKVAHRTVEINQEVIDTKNYKSNLKYCIPRPKYVKKLKNSKKIIWKFDDSIWPWYGYNYDGEKDELYDAAFEFDYTRCNFDKDKNLFNIEEKNKLKSILRQRYKNIFETYKYFSAKGGYKIWQIDQNQIIEFAQNCEGLIDNKYSINDFLDKVTEVKSNNIDKLEQKNNNQNVPENIIRHQFLMLLVKIAKDKYFKTKQIEKLTDAIEYAFVNNYENYLNTYDNNKWRIERYYLEVIDNFIKAHIPIFDAVFNSYAQPQIKGKNDACWMSLDNFTKLCNEIMDEDFPVKDIPIVFNISIKLVIDEIHSDKQYNMIFPEFLEAISRFIDRLSPVPIGEEKLKWDMNRRKSQTLLKKLETMIPRLIKLIDDKYKNIRDNFALPIKDKETGKYIIDYENEFYEGKIPMKDI